MLQCQCPDCNSTLECSVSDFGQIHHCKHCGQDFKLDTVNLIHYKLPKKIEIQLLTEEGMSFTKFPVPVIVDYGYYIPPFLSDKKGQLTISRELMIEAKFEQASIGIMDSRYDDYSLNRYMKIIVFSKQESILRSNKRIASGWPINNLEKKLYGTMDKLIAAFIPSEDIAHIEKFIDLSQERVPANLEITITTKYRR